MDLRTTVSLLLLLLLGLCNAEDDTYHDADDEIRVDHSDTEELTKTILRMNNGSSDFLLEGDVMIPTTRNAMKCLQGKNSCLWPKSANGNVEVPYVLSNSYDNTEVNEIQRAMKSIQSKTCIRFIPHRNQEAYLSLEPRYGCASLMGRTGGKQVVSLQRSGCVSAGIIQHELLHSLGFYHEHTRSDRDTYIKINWDNINEVFANNFQKQDTNNLNTPYDYSSIMHYGRTAFAKPGLDSIIPIPDSSVPIGQRSDLSKLDILRVNKLYQC
ncbi:low choriolytic enzyme-like [Etheostoma cragini]|uniref:low choriolytic enzyme-like n=1 Tax=Etheostoma cragini TaxID=417921 RepID=UPI00155EF2A6|nr:low choriolytic enzyme-like [Etheostoma cragini]